MALAQKVEPAIAGAAGHLQVHDQQIDLFAVPRQQFRELQIVVGGIEQGVGQVPAQGA